MVARHWADTLSFPNLPPLTTGSHSASLQLPSASQKLSLGEMPQGLVLPRRRSSPSHRKGQNKARKNQAWIQMKGKDEGKLHFST